MQLLLLAYSSKLGQEKCHISKAKFGMNRSTKHKGRAPCALEIYLLSQSKALQGAQLPTINLQAIS